MNVEDRDLELDGQPVHLRQAGALRGALPPTLYVHGLPGDGGDWEALLERTSGLAPDLLGFGRSGKGGHLDYSPAALSRFLMRLVDHLEIPRLRIAAHGRGALVAAEFATAQPERVERILLFSPAPSPGVARWLVRPLLGELLMGSLTRGLMRRWYRRGAGGAESFPQERVDEVWERFDQGTQRAILRLLRAPASRGTIAGGPLLIIEGELDPWRGAYEPPVGSERASYATGHWPWLHPEAAERAVAFLTDAG